MIPKFGMIQNQKKDLNRSSVVTKCETGNYRLSSITGLILNKVVVSNETNFVILGRKYSAILLTNITSQFHMLLHAQSSKLAFAIRPQ